MSVSRHGCRQGRPWGFHPPRLSCEKGLSGPDDQGVAEQATSYKGEKEALRLSAPEQETHPEGTGHLVPWDGGSRGPTCLSRLTSCSNSTSRA